MPRQAVRRKVCALDRAFTLIELLVVIAIIALLVSILMPALSKAKEIAMRSKCAVQSRATASAALLYADDYGSLPARGGGGARFDLASGDGSVLALLSNKYVTSPYNFRCPALIGREDWNRDVDRWTSAGYLGYQFVGFSSFIYGQTPDVKGVYFISPDKIPGPSDYILLGCNVIDDVAAVDYHNFQEMNWTGHTRQLAQGANTAHLDTSVRWLSYRPEERNYYVMGPNAQQNFAGPFWETMVPAKALFVRDIQAGFGDHYDNGYATTFFWTGNAQPRDPLDDGGSKPRRGVVLWFH